MKKLLKIFFLFILYLSISRLNAQIETAGTPILKGLKSMNEIPVIEIDIDKIIAVKNSEQYLQSSFKTEKIAHLINIEIDTEFEGTWINYNGKDIWQVAIYAKDAKSIGLLFGKYKLPENAKLFVYNENGIRGAYSEINNKLFGSLMVAPITGDIVNIELQIPETSKSDPEIEISAITYGIKDLSNIHSMNTLNSGYCHIDVNCYSDAKIQQIKNSVVKIIANGTDLCSGTLINNNLIDGKKYILTANHCISSNAAANNSIFYFDFESPFCDGPYVIGDKNISGSSLIATKQSLDFSLIELSADPPYHYHPYYSGWNIDTINIPNTFSIHHPSGDMKKISIDNDSPEISSYDDSFDQGAFFRIKEWDMGTTEGGSSGGPLFNNNYQLIGTLTGGTADCVNPIDDYYAMLAKSWDDYPDSGNQLKYWLDPLKSGTSSLDGFDPFTDTKIHNITMDNIEQDDQLICDKAGDWGYITGHNSYDYNLYAEKFNTSDSVSLIAFYINVAKAKKVFEFGKVRFQVWTNNLDDTSIVYFKDYYIDNFQENKYSLIELDDFYPIFGDFYIGYRLFYLGDQDTFALFHTYPKVQLEKNTAFAYKFSTGWIPLYEVIGESKATSLDIKPIINNPDIINDVKSLKIENIISIFPNPSNSILNVISENQSYNIYAIYDIHGRLIFIRNLEHNTHKTEIDISCFQNGIYFIKIWNKDDVNFYKFIVRH